MKENNRLPYISMVVTNLRISGFIQKHSNVSDCHTLDYWPRCLGGGKNAKKNIVWPVHFQNGYWLSD